MVFSRQKMEAAMSYMSATYDKILLINFEEDSFFPIKINDQEWEELPKCLTFSQWVTDFMCGSKFKRIDDGNVVGLGDLIIATKKKSIERSYIFNYYKMINGEFHIMQSEVHPIGRSLAYLYVKDMTKVISNDMKGSIYE